MRVLLDENLPYDLVGALKEHAVSTVSAGPLRLRAYAKRAARMDPALPMKVWASVGVPTCRSRER